MGTIKLGGLISGMDTESIIQQIMDAERIRVTAQENRKKALEAQRTAWGQIKTSLESLRTKLDGVRLSSAFRARSASIVDSTVAAVTASSGAAMVTRTLKVQQLAQAQRVASVAQVSDPAAALGLPAGTLTVNGKSVTVAATDSLYKLRDNINAAGAGVVAEVEQFMSGTTAYYRLVLTSAKTGVDNAISISETVASGDPTQSILKNTALQLRTDTGWANQITAPANAIFYLDGDANRYEKASNEVTDVLQGVTLTLKGTNTTYTSFTIGQDTDKAVTAVQDWVTALNDSMTLLRGLTKIGSVDEGTANGALSGDVAARSLLYSLQGYLSQQVANLPSDMNSLASIGVTTGKYDTTDFGKALVDADKLRAALKNDPDAVARIFGAVTGPNTTGIAKDMYAKVNETLAFQTGTVATKDSSLSDAMDEIDDRIRTLNDRLARREEALRRQFTRLESSMNQMQTQGSAFLAQMAMWTQPQNK